MDAIGSFLDGAKEGRLSFRALRGIRVDHVERELVSCDFRVPSHLLDKNGLLAPGAVASLVDEMGATCCALNLVGVLPTTIVTVDMSISYLSTAKLDDELEISAKLLGTKGNYSGIAIMVKNKVTGKLIADGRNSLFHQQTSKL